MRTEGVPTSVPGSGHPYKKKGGAGIARPTVFWDDRNGPVILGISRKPA